MPQKHTTIKDVARKAGVSVSTASRVLNNKSTVNNDMREKVEKAMNDLNFNANQAARSLVKKSADCIGVLVTNLHDSFFSDLVRGFETGAEETGMNVIFCSTLKEEGDNAATARDKYIKFLSNGITDAVILYGSYLTDTPIVRFLQSRKDFEYLVIENEIVDIECNQILIDNEGGARAAVDYLYEKGHREIAFLLGDPNRKIASDRYNGYMQAMRNHNLYIRNGYIQFAYNDDDCAARTRDLLNLKNRPTAIFCSDDHFASIVISEIERQGLNVPEDVSVMGFDNRKYPYPNYKGPDITTIEQPLFEIGRDSIVSLAKKIAENDENFIKLTYKTKLIEKESVKDIN